MHRAIDFRTLIAVGLLLLVSALPSGAQDRDDAERVVLRAEKNADRSTIAVYRDEEAEPILVQNAPRETRPYIHPIEAPDGNGVLTQIRPGHHTHQTGLYWGFKRLNGRDYFAACCKPDTTGYYRRVSYHVVRGRGPQVRWQTVYDLLDEDGDPVLTETQSWTMQKVGDEFLIDLEWRGEAKVDVTIGEFFVGGLFLRMPWHEGVAGEVVNASGRAGSEAEAQRAPWIDVGMEIEGREDWGHIAMLDHPENAGFPIPWRVDGQMGVGPSRQIMGDWHLPAGQEEIIRYRIIAYTGELRPLEMNRRWSAFAIDGPR